MTDAASAKESTEESPRWSGISKVIEECAELQFELSLLQKDLAKLQASLAKLHAYPDGKHPDARYAGPLIGRIEEELGDVMAACDHFVAHNPEISLGVVMDRWQRKLERFEAWRAVGHPLAGTASPPAAPGAKDLAAPSSEGPSLLVAVLANPRRSSRVVETDESELTYGQRLARETGQTGIKKW